MNRSAHFFVGKCCDDTLDLPPMAESQDIARVATAFSARGGLQPGVVAEPIEQVRCLFKGEAAGDEGRVHGRSLTRNLFPESRRSWSTDRSPCSAGAGAARPPLPWGGMAKRTPMAGGFLLMAAILIGAVWGVATGNPMKGILIGTGTGIAIALLIWLLDSRSRS